MKANAMRHMMPKEILDAVELQPQHRTFSEIRDYMLQQARQRADVYVGRCVSFDYESWYCHATCEHEHDHSHRSKGHSSGSQWMYSQMGSDVSKPEKDEQENDSYQYEQDQDCYGDEAYAVKGKAKGGFKGTFFKCGMRGHKNDRCRQKGKGKGSK